MCTETGGGGTHSHPPARRVRYGDTLALEPVDAVRTTTIVDNVADMMLPDAGAVRPPDPLRHDGSRGDKGAGARVHRRLPAALPPTLQKVNRALLRFGRRGAHHLQPQP